MTVVTTPIPGRDKTLQATEPVRLVQHKGRVLLAEDNQASQMVLQRMVRAKLKVKLSLLTLHCFV
jgi:hypothetical protein